MKFGNFKNIKGFVKTVIEYGFWTSMNFLAIGILDEWHSYL